MKINICLAWIKDSASAKRYFKTPEAFSLLEDYVVRISKFSSVSISPFPKSKKSGSQTWLCDRSFAKKNPSSDELAKKMDQLLISGISELNILIGGANGFTKEDLETWKPDFVWSFGAMTLPHELAAVVSAEQIYRAWTILKNLPYHLDH